MKLNIALAVVAVSLSGLRSAAEPLSSTYEAAQGVVSRAVESQRSAAKGLSPAVSHDLPQPVELMSQSFESGREGVTLAEAVKLCAQSRSMYEGRYFFVYCTFHEKNWTETHIGHGTYTDYRVLGYVTSEESYSASVGSGERSALWGLYRRQDPSRSVSVSSYRQEPVIMRVEVPYEYKYSEQKNIYGVRVMGLGEIGPDSPSIKMFDSANVVPGLELTVFATEKSALLACQQILLSVTDEQAKYHRAYCQARMDASGSWVYEVRSQNPLLR